MSLKSILFAGAAAFALLSTSSAVPAFADDQNDETRDLNLRQLDRPGAGVRAVPGHEDDDAYDDDDDDGGAADDDDDDDDDVIGGPGVGDEFGDDDDDDDDDD